MNVLDQRFENEVIDHLTEIKIHQSDCLTDEDWEVLGIGPAIAYKSGWHEGFYEAFRLFKRKEQ